MNRYDNLLPFIGRDQEVAEIARLLGGPDCRLLTLHGLSGVGKTRLAYEIGQRLQANFKNGVSIVDLGPWKTPDQIPNAITEVLPGFSLSSRKDLLSHLTDYLSELELAALWARSLSCQVIADRLRDDISLLHTRLTNVPPNHRSIHAVFFLNIG